MTKKGYKRYQLNAIGIAYKAMVEKRRSEMLQTSVYIKKTIIHHPTPEPAVLLERITETRDLNSGHLHSQVEPLPVGYVGSDPEEKAALVKLAPMPSGYHVALMGRGWRGTQEEYDKRTGMGTRPAIDVQSANAAQADALKQAMRPTSPTMLAPTKRKA